MLALMQNCSALWTAAVESTVPVGSPPYVVGVARRPPPPAAPAAPEQEAEEEEPRRVAAAILAFRWRGVFRSLAAGSHAAAAEVTRRNAINMESEGRC
jgi:hypothetical protein